MKLKKNVFKQKLNLLLKTLDLQFFSFQTRFHFKTITKYLTPKYYFQACATPDALTDGSFSTSGGDGLYLSGDTITYKCNIGFTMIAHKISFLCTDGSYDATFASGGMECLAGEKMFFFYVSDVKK